MMQSVPVAPWQLLPVPCAPGFALKHEVRVWDECARTQEGKAEYETAYGQN